jgi:hypothetical protein
MPVPVQAVPVVRTQVQNQVLGDRTIKLEIGWCREDKIARVLVSTRHRDNLGSEKRTELFCRSQNEVNWLFCDALKSPEPKSEPASKVRSYLLERYNLDLDWSGRFWEGELPY